MARLKLTEARVLWDKRGGDKRGGDGPALARAAPGYLPALDGLRAVAIVLVVASHAGAAFLPGAFGVTLFFFISGYLITRQLLYGISARSRIGLGGFYMRRALRLLPASLVYTVVAGIAFAAAGGVITPLGWVTALFYGANLFDVWVGYRSTLAGVRHPFNILWSLAIEEHFYALWPLVLGAIWRWRHAAVAVLLICLAVLGWRLVLFDACGQAGWPGLCGRVQPDPVWRYNRLYLGTDARIDSIAWGALLAIAEHRRAGWVAHAARSAILAPAGLAILAASFLLPGAFARHVLRATLQGVSLLVIFPGLLDGGAIIGRLLSAWPAVLVGRLSYSLYLWHWGAFALADRLAGGNRAAWLAIGVPCAALFAATSYICIERPMLRLRRRAGSHVPLRIAPPKAREARHAAS